MADDVRVLVDDYVRLRKTLRTIDPKIRRAYTKRIREAAGSIGRHVLEAGTASLPRRGGLAARLGQSPVSTSLRAGGVDLWIGKRGKSQLGRINRLGLLRRPVWARSDRPRSDWAWVDQDVERGTLDEAFANIPPEDRAKLAKVLTDIGNELRKA